MCGVARRAHARFFGDRFDAAASVWGRGVMSAGDNVRSFDAAVPQPAQENPSRNPNFRFKMLSLKLKIRGPKLHYDEEDDDDDKETHP